MQESYISLDPAMADMMTSQQRNRVFSQRLTEAKGGDASEYFGMQLGMTLSIMTYTVMRNKGFRITPFNAMKIPTLGGVLFVGCIGNAIGTDFTAGVLGDRSQKSYLHANKSAILAGTASFDKPNTQ